MAWGATRWVDFRMKLAAGNKTKKSAMAISRLHPARRPLGPKKIGKRACSGDGEAENAGAMSVNAWPRCGFCPVRIYDGRGEQFRFGEAAGCGYAKGFERGR
jgi:hypothetical protein